MERDSFIFYKSFYESIVEADMETQNKIFNAICKKALYDEDTELTGIAKMLYTLIKPQLEANNKRFSDGAKGGRPKKETSGYENKKTNVNENDNVNDNVGDSRVDDLRDVIDFYNNNIGMITPHCLDVLADYSKTFTNDMLMLALKKATEANVRTIQYIKGILNNWDKKGIKTVADVQREDENRKKEVCSQEETEEEKKQRKIKELQEVVWK